MKKEILQQIRKDFTILNDEKIIYLDSSATSLTPNVVIECIVDYYHNYNANIHRSLGGLASKATTEFEQSRKKVAEFIGAKPEEIIFTKNCTESINLIANNLVNELEDGDEILLTITEHNSNFLVWQELAKKRNIKIKFIEIHPDGSLNIDQMKNLFTKKTKLLSITQTSNVLGIINPVKEITRFAHEHNCVVLIDGAQSVGHIPINVHELEVDFMAFSAHKMLGPTGVGVLFISEEQKNKNNFQPLIYGGGIVSKVTKKETDLLELPWRLEAGTPNIADVIGFGKAIDYLNKVGIESVEEHLKELTNYAFEKLSQLKNIVILGSKENKTGLISFYIKNISSEDISLFLTKKGFQLRVGTHCANLLFEELKIKNALRISFYIYNTKEEIDLFVTELKKIIIKLGGN